MGISACLLGERVRYDGGHKRHAWLVDELAGELRAGLLGELAVEPGGGEIPDPGVRVAWVAVCPEVEIGLGVPRETIDLVRGGSGEVRLVASRTGRDLTAAMTGFAAARVRELAAAGLSGYVLKSRSPSCGLAGVPVWGPGGPGAERSPVIRDGRGLFAAALRAGLPDLPTAEERDLDHSAGRADFVARVVRYHAARVRGFDGAG